MFILCLLYIVLRAFCHVLINGSQSVGQRNLNITVAVDFSGISACKTSEFVRTAI